MQGLTEPFLNIVGCCNFTETKSCEVCTVLLDKGIFLYNQMTLAKNAVCLKLSIGSIVCLGCLAGSDLDSKVYKV